MPLPTLEDLDALVNEACMDVLGDTLTYTPAGQSARTLKGYVENTEAIRDLQTGQVIEQAMTVQVLVVDVPARPSGAVRIALPKKPGKTYKPANVRMDRSGTHWEFELVAVA